MSDAHPTTRARSLATRWLGVGLAASLAVITIALAVTDRLALYVNPDSAWFVVGMAVLLLVGAVATFALPLGAETDHGHDHDHDHDHVEVTGTGMPVAAVAGGVLASGVVLTMLAVPAASLSTDIAMARDVGAPPLFAGSDVVSLASSGDTSTFGVGEWASVFASATSPDAFDGDPVTLTGFVTPGTTGFDLTRLVITHCVIDAQPASVSISLRPAQGPDAEAPETGQWVTISGTVRSTNDGGLAIRADDVTAIDEPADPYEY